MGLSKLFQSVRKVDVDDGERIAEILYSFEKNWIFWWFSGSFFIVFSLLSKYDSSKTMKRLPKNNFCQKSTNFQLIVWG